MKEPIDQVQQWYDRLREIFTVSRQRYIDAGGNPQHLNSLMGNDGFRDEKRREAKILMRQLLGVQISGDTVSCQGRSWKIPVKSEAMGVATKCES